MAAANHITASKGAFFANALAWIDELSDEELFVPQQRRWSGDKWPLVKWIQVNTIAPYNSARTKVRRWKRSLA